MNNVDDLFMVFFGLMLGISLSAFYEAINVTVSVGIISDAQAGFSVVAIALCVTMIAVIIDV